MNKQNDNIWSLLQILIPVLGLVSLIWLLTNSLNTYATYATSNSTEIRLVLLIAIVVAVLLTILTIMAAVFKQLNLSNARQALGLPEGSIRALIALLFLMMFVVFAIYLFRQVVGFNWDYMTGLTETQINTLNLSDIYRQEGPDANGKYNVWLRIKDVSPAGEQFAQQIFTALLTLVTAVSSFYFASRVVEEHQAPKQSETLVSSVSVTGITPNSGDASKGKIAITNLAGTGFVKNARVKLQQTGQSDIDATDVEVLNESRILCTFDLTEKHSGKWDVVVVNDNNKEARLVDGFDIK